MITTKTDPGRIVVAGDWHGNTGWARHVIDETAEKLKDEPVRVILQLGDFLPTFYVPEGRSTPEKRRRWVAGYLSALDMELERYDAWLYFVEGNHEDHELLQEVLAKQATTGIPVPLSSSGRVQWLPRGTRWRWHGREWLALGGAASPNRSRLTEGWNWWPDEYITDDDVARAGVAPADVMLTHEAPAGAPVRYLEPPPSSFAPEDLEKSEDQRRKIAQVAFMTGAGYLFHGHHHQAYQARLNLPDGPWLSVTGLDMDGTDVNWDILDTQTMEWESNWAVLRRETS